MIGPFRGGRVNAVSGVPGQPNTFYFGSVGGGVWKSTNAGRTWTPVFDSQPVASIGAIAVAPSNPNVVYVGTGESDMRDSIAFGNGMYKSTDAGRTWTHIGLDATRQIGRVLVDPKNPDIVFVAALGHAYGPSPDRGVYRSRDGGATWQKVLFKNDNVGAVDLAFDPANPQVVYAAPVGHAPSALVHLRAVERPGRRHLQVHRRRHDVAAAHDRPSDRRPRPHRHRRGADQRQPRVRHRRREGRRALSFGRRRRELDQDLRRQAHLGTRLVLRQGHRRSEEPGHRLRVEHVALQIDGRGQELDADQGRARRRRLSSALDRSRRPEPDDSSPATRAPSSPSTARRRGAPGTTSRPRSSTTSRPTTASRTG